MTDLLRVARPQFLISGLMLYVFGTCWAILSGAGFSLARSVFGYLILLPAHLSISYSNDYFDVNVDKYDKPTLFSGGSGILVDHPGLREPARSAAIALILCSIAIGIVFQIVYSLPIWFSGFIVFCNLLGWFYSAPPLRLAYRGLGELSMALSVSLLIPGLGYLAANGPMGQDALLFTLPLVLLGLAFVLTVEIPDMESDRLGNKRTWVARKGRGFGFAVIAASFLLVTLFFLWLPWAASRVYPVDLHVLGILSLLPLAASCVSLLKRPAERVLATRAVYGIMLALGAFCILADAYMVHLALGQML